MNTLSRRDVLKQSLTIGAAAMLAGPLSSLRAPAAEGERSKKMRYGLCTFRWAEAWDLPTLLANCEKAQVFGVELRTGHGHGVELRLSPQQRREVKQRFAASPVTLVGLGTNECFDSPDPEQVKRSIETAKAFVRLSRDCGGSGVKVKPNDFHPNVPHEKTIEQIGKALNVLGRFAADFGQQIRLEVHGSCYELPTIKQIMDVADDPNVTVCWNCNSQDLKGQGLEHNFNLVKNRLGATLHIRELDSGTYPFQRLIELLVKSQYAGWVLLEGRKVPRPKDRVARLAEQRALFERMVDDAFFHEILVACGVKNTLREDLQRPVDARLLKMETAGIEGSGLFPGQIHRAHNAQEVQALSGKLSPGDQLVLAGSDWKDKRFTFEGRGTAGAPILIRPDKPGSVVFTGMSSVSFCGEHLVVSGLEFKDGTVAENEAVVFRLGDSRHKPADNCVVNRIKIEHCNSPSPEDWPRIHMWYVKVHGRDNTIANSTFADLENYGQMLAAPELPTTGLQRLHILNNRFVNRPKLDLRNGYEIIQIGWSGEKARPSGSLIQGNYFEDCDGEIEIITLKASDVFVRNNTFAGCQGALCLRHSDRVLVQGNIFDGKGRPNTGGVRVAGAEHVIIGNTFRNLEASSNSCWTISLMCADVETSGDSVGYGRVKNILIAHNRFDRNKTRIAVGIHPRPEYPLLPHNIRVQDNLFTGMAATSPFDYVSPDPAGALSKTLHESGNRYLP